MTQRVSQKSIRFTVVFNRKKKFNAKGIAPIEIQAYQNRERVFVSTKISVAPGQWDEKKKIIRSNHPQYEVLNAQIQTMIGQYERMQIERMSNNVPFTLDDFRKASVQSEKSQSFLDFMKEQIEASMEIKQKTKTSHFNTVNHLRKFVDEKDVSFSDLNYEFVQNFLNYLRSLSKHPNTIHKQWKNLKKYIELAIKIRALKITNPCKEFKLRETPPKRVVLTFDELVRLQELDLSKYEKKFDVIRDMFLFSCYTGLRISDARNLQTNFAMKDEKGWNLDFRTIKTDKRAELPLYLLFAGKDGAVSKAETLFCKYYNPDEVYLFPRISEKEINVNLKVIAELANIKINLTYEIGRHTFGTYMASKIALPVLMLLMQHSSIQTTMKYVHINQEMVEKGLIAVNWES